MRPVERPLVSASFCAEPERAWSTCADHPHHRSSYRAFLAPLIAPDRRLPCQRTSNDGRGRAICAVLHVVPFGAPMSPADKNLVGSLTLKSLSWSL
eukprot:scaffold125762_cov57-Phaeocystis_antarctica.AAC.2